MNVEDQGSNLLILLDTGGRFSREMFVISASVDPENAAESLNAVLKSELVDRV